MTVVFRYEVPVDDRWHRIEIDGEPLHVAGRHVDVVEFWALAGTGQPTEAREYRVFGTGHALPDEPLTFRGTVVHPALVWHLFERRAR